MAAPANTSGPEDAPGDAQDLTLGGEFSAPTREEWREQVTAALRRSGLIGDTPPPDPVEEVVATTGYDGIVTHPLYTDDAGTPTGHPGGPPFTRGARAAAAAWYVRQLADAPDSGTANTDILADLDGGATSAWVRLGAGGSPIRELRHTLDGVLLDLAGIVLDAGADFADAAHTHLDLARERGISTTALSGNLGADPLGVQLRTGNTPDLDAAADLARRCAQAHTGSAPQLRAVVVDAVTLHAAGGSDADELGGSLAAGVTYLRALVNAGLDVDTACGMLEFRYAADADQFRTLTKLRAARRLWERVTRACGASEPARAQAQHAVTSPSMMTEHDPWVNMLRATIAAFAAGAGGARAVTVRPFDAALGTPDAFGRRIARNTQALLLDETRLAQVTDPAGGSWYVEQLTDDLAHAAWSWFQELEAAGGLPAAVEDGLVENRLAATWQRRHDALAHRREPITGVSEYPRLDEELPRRPEAPAEPGGGLPQHRYAEAFEHLRDAADAHLAATGHRPRVFLATLGTLAQYTARASFARNLFAVAGIDTVEAGPTENAEDVVAEFTAAGTPVACLCSADTLYTERAADTAQALSAAGAERVLLAGKPAAAGDAAETVDGFVFAGCDALTTVTNTLATLGVQP